MAREAEKNVSINPLNMDASAQSRERRYGGVSDEIHELEERNPKAALAIIAESNRIADDLMYDGEMASSLDRLSIYERKIIRDLIRQGAMLGSLAVFKAIVSSQEAAKQAELLKDQFVEVQPSGD